MASGVDGQHQWLFLEGRTGYLDWFQIDYPPPRLRVKEGLRLNEGYIFKNIDFS